MTSDAWKYIESVPIDRIHFLNPRLRDKRKFRDLVESIAAVGLKRPITVCKIDTDREDAKKL